MSASPQLTDSPPTQASDPAPQGARVGRLPRFRVLRLLVGLLALVTAVYAGNALWRDYSDKRLLPPTGGMFFPRRVELPVGLFSQGDPAWGDDQLGPSDQTMGEAGCAVTSAAMVLHSYGVDTDPGRLNAYCDEHGGYTPQGWLYWEKAAETSGGAVRHVYEDLPSYWLMDSNLLRGNPVIVRLRMPSGITHFVVVMGKQGWDYLIQDPSGIGRRRGVYPLKDFGSNVEALRFYEKVTPAVRG